MALALLAVAIWGTNFVVIKLALGTLSPLWFATLRFLLASVPFLMFVAQPRVAGRWLAGAGLAIGVGQFGLLFLAMRGSISPGLASLLIQTQVFFTIGLAAMWLGERVSRWQWTGLAIAALGIGVIAGHADASATPMGIGLVLGAALAWSLGNLFTKRAGPVDMIAFTIWSSVYAVPVLAILAWVVEGPQALLTGLERADAVVWAAVFWQAIGNTVIGYGIWNWLLSKHAAALVTPMALLVPVFGMGASALLLAEPLHPWKLLAAGLVLCGIALAVLGPRLFPRRPEHLA